MSGSSKIQLKDDKEAWIVFREAVNICHAALGYFAVISKDFEIY